MWKGLKYNLYTVLQISYRYLELSWDSCDFSFSDLAKAFFLQNTMMVRKSYQERMVLLI